MEKEGEALWSVKANNLQCTMPICPRRMRDLRTGPECPKPQLRQLVCPDLEAGTAHLPQRLYLNPTVSPKTGHHEEKSREVAFRELPTFRVGMRCLWESHRKNKHKLLLQCTESQTVYSRQKKKKSHHHGKNNNHTLSR